MLWNCWCLFSQPSPHLEACILVVATSGILPYMIGLCIFYFEWTAKLAGWILSSFGWVAMVSRQSVVLYSRSGIVLGRGYEKLLMFVKWMIIIDGVVFHVTTTVVMLGARLLPKNHHWSAAYRYVEKIQMTGFCIQEFIVSGLYVWKTVDILRSSKKKHTHRIMWQLFLINAMIIVLDIGLLVLEYKDLFIPEVSFKELAYSVKLKLEFAILSKLVGISQKGRRRFSLSGNIAEFLHEDARSLPPAESQTLAPTNTATSHSRWTIDSEKTCVEAVDDRKRSDIDRDLNPSTNHRSPHTDSELCDTGNDRQRSAMLYADAMRQMSR